MPDIRRRLRSVDLPGREEFTLRNAFRWTSRGLFVGVFLLAVSLSFGADAIAFALLGSVLLAQMLYVVLPVERIRARAYRLWSGEAGGDAYEELEERGGRLR
jgi:hypothetical protein